MGRPHRASHATGKRPQRPAPRGHPVHVYWPPAPSTKMTSAWPATTPRPGSRAVPQPPHRRAGRVRGRRLHTRRRLLRLRAVHPLRPERPGRRAHPQGHQRLPTVAGLLRRLRHRPRPRREQGTRTGGRVVPARAPRRGPADMLRLASLSPATGWSGATSSAAGYAGGPWTASEPLLEIEHAGALRAGLARRERNSSCRLRRTRRLCAGGDSRAQSGGPDAWAPRARLAVRKKSRSVLPPDLGVLHRDARQLDA
jgi:hypothetical protein